MIPLAFAGCAGWLHPADGERGVVLCSAHGFEELGARRSWRRLADRLASAGLPTLRFDYPGTGDSVGSDADPDRVAAWLASIGEAVAALRRETRVSEVALVGLRLGALLAAEAAARRGDIAALALLAPPQSGRAYGREMAALSAVLAPPGVTSMVADEPVDGVETAGFLLTRSTLDDLKRLDGRKLPCLAPRVLFMADGAAQPPAGWAAEGQVETAPFPGAAALLRDPTTAETPETDWARLAAWLAEGAATAAPGSPSRRSAWPAMTVEDDRADAVATFDAASWSRKVAIISGRSRAAAEGKGILGGAPGGRGWKETSSVFGPGGRLVGVLNEPAAPALGRPVVVVLNAGGNPHTGWARQAVDLCRHLASQGVASLRMDMLGFGDAGEPADGRARLFYADESHADVVAAVDWLGARGYAEIALAGQCSGAYRAFHSALAEPRVTGLVMLNTQIFAWRDGLTLDAAMRDSYRATGFYLSRLAVRRTWARLFNGEIKAQGIGLELLRRAGRALRGRAAALVRRPTAGANPVRDGFRALSDRGVRVLLVYAEDDGGRDELARHMGPGCRESVALPGVAMRIIPGADHNLTPRHARQAYADHVAAFFLAGESSSRAGAAQRA